MKGNKKVASLCMAAAMAASTLIGVIPATAVYADDWQTTVYKADEFYATLSPDADKQGEIVTVDQTGQLWQYGYYNDEVGYQSFNNMFYGENLWQMTQDAPSGSAANWDYGDYALPGRYIYPAVQYDSAVTFYAPMEGTVTIASTGAWVGGGSADGIRIAIYAGDTRIWPTDSEWCDINSTNGNSVTVPEITVALHKDEPLHFRLNCNGNATGDMSCWYPQLSYMSLQYLQQYAPGVDQSNPVFSAKDDYTVPTEESGVVKIDQTGKTWQYGYYSESEGYQPFNTQYFADGVWRMTTDSDGGPNWGYGVYSTNANIYPAGGRDNAVTFTAPREGTVSVTAENNNAWVDGATTDGIQIAIYAGDTRVWPTDSDWCVLNSSNGNSVTIPEVKVALHKDEQLHFRINCGGSSQNDRTFWYPTVTYISEEYQDQYAPGYVPEPETGDVYPFQVSATQGENGWYYLYAEIGQDLLNFQPAFISDWWWTAQDDFTTGIVRSEGLHPGEYDAILGFKAPYTGKIKISFAGDKVESKESCAGDDGMPENATVLVQNLSATGNSFSYENVVVRNNRSRGLLIRSVDGSITNCTLENNGMAGILITGTLKDIFCESGFANNVTVRKNLIRGNGYYGNSKEYSAIAITSDSATSGDPDCQNHTNIVIEGNVFEDRYSDNAISVESAKNVKIFNNTFKARSSAVNSDAPKDTVAPIRMTGSTDIEVSGNHYPDGTVVRAMLSSTVVNAYGTDLGKMSSEVVSSELSTCRENGKWSVKVTLKNLTNEVQKGTWKTVSPLEMFRKELTGDFELQPGETKSYTIPVGKTALQLADPDDLVDVTVAHCVTGRDYSYNTASLSFASAQKTDKAIIIDGTAAEDAWTTAEPMFLNRVNQTSVLAGWKGIDDLSAEVRFLWDAQNLYFYVEVTDDVHSQPKSDDTIWLGDSIQMAFSPDGSANYAEMTWALGNDGKVYSNCGHNTIPKKGRSAGNAIAGGSCVIRRDEDANKTYYEASIPWAFIGINGEAPEDGTAMPVSLMLPSGRTEFQRSQTVVAPILTSYSQPGKSSLNSSV
jgi:hypothetical protein